MSAKWNLENPEKVRKSRRDWYERNKDKQKKYKLSRDKELREWYNALKNLLIVIVV